MAILLNAIVSHASSPSVSSSNLLLYVVRLSSFPQHHQHNIVYLPLLGKRNDAILTSKAAPTDQGLDKDSELDVQLERSVWQCLLKEIPYALRHSQI